MGIFGSKSKAKGKGKSTAKQPRRGKDGRFKANRTLFDRVGRRSTNSTIKQEKIRYQRVKAGSGHVEIPVDKKGNVPHAAIASRFLQRMSGDRQGRTRNPILDQNTNAKIIIEPDKNGNFKPEDLALWWKNPNEYDVKGIDTMDADIFNVSMISRKGSQAAQKKIAVFAPNDTDYKAIRKALDNGFTVTELKAMVEEKGLSIVVDDSISSPGQYSPTTNTIKLQSDALAGTTIHEAVHRLRETDKTRKDAVSKGRPITTMSSKDRDLEESATTAETFIRLDAYADPNYISYYGAFSDPKGKIEQDRKKFQPNGKPLKGKRAVKSLEKNFDNSNIGNLSMHSGTPAKTYLTFLRKEKRY